jgi:hypothetical protein
MTATNKRLFISESRSDLNRCTPCREKPDQHATHFPHSVRVWSKTIRISHGPHIATFHTAVNRFEQINCPQEEGLLIQSIAHRLTTQISHLFMSTCIPRLLWSQGVSVPRSILQLLVDLMTRRLRWVLVCLSGELPSWELGLLVCVWSCGPSNWPTPLVAGNSEPVTVRLHLHASLIRWWSTSSIKGSCTRALWSSFTKCVLPLIWIIQIYIWIELQNIQ